MKKKTLLLITISLFNACFVLGQNITQTAHQNSSGAASAKQTLSIDSSGNTVVQRNFYLRIGAIESIKNGKYLLKQKTSEIEFYVNNETKIFLTSKSTFDDINTGNYVVIRGPRNKRVALANSVSVYKDKKLFMAFNNKDEYVIKGTVIQKEPFIISLDNEGRNLRIEYDEDTYWILNKEVDANEIKVGDRTNLYFDTVVSIRYKNYPIKIAINRDKPEN